MPKTKVQRPKTNQQVRRMFGLATPLAKVACMEPAEYLRDMASHITDRRTASIAELTFDEANAAIKLMGGDPLPAKGNSYRNQNYRKQQAGIKTIETDRHLEFIREQAALRNMSEAGLASMAAGMHLPWPTQTTEQGNKLAEALKAMNKRDNLVPFPGRSLQKPARSKGTEPKFRRVA